MKRRLLILPLGLLIAYGALRLTTALFNELRDVLFAKVRYHAVYKISVKVLDHLHKMSLRFHLERQTGSIIRDLERGTQSLSSLINYMIFIILTNYYRGFSGWGYFTYHIRHKFCIYNICNNYCIHIIYSKSHKLENEF